jgi:adenylate kinase
MVLNLIILGAPGAGKGTVAQAVSNKFGLVQVSTGDLIRAEVASGSELAKELQDIMSSGGLVGDELVAKMLEAKLKELSAKEDFSGVIFDGFPRTIPQADELEHILLRLEQKLDVVINIESSEENIVKRLSSRWSCPKCKAIFNSVTNLPKEEGKCDLDGEALFQRDDDKPEAVKQRLVQYNKKTAPLIEYYKEKGLLKSYDGNCTPQESIERGMKLVEELMS